MKNIMAVYQNGRRIVFQEVYNISDAVNKAKKYFSDQGKTIDVESTCL